ncbi:hypothetical protein [Streptomyces alfalfae]|uniref:hypothetical protein n=1 Tax=Streptomyces alfalfae TaxID=1642299 RepID=UPI0028121B2F|nr:hypothetical protein [Streptomyces alfalfae]
MNTPTPDPAEAARALLTAQQVTWAIHEQRPDPARSMEYREGWEAALDAAIGAARNVLPAPADRAAALTDAERTMLTYALNEAQEHIWSRDGFTDEDQAALDSLRRLAAEAQPATPDTETAEQRADREETERDHARGDHTYCGITCETEMPTEHLQNFVIAKGYPGTKGALDELLRRARAAVVLPTTPDTEDPARVDRLRPEFTDHASVEAIDAQLDRARRQERRWHLRSEWLIGLRQRRVEQEARGEQPAVSGAAAEPAQEA